VPSTLFAFVKTDPSLEVPDIEFSSKGCRLSPRFVIAHPFYPRSGGSAREAVR
jgi:hypothetical protein